MSARSFVWVLGVLLAASASHASEEWAFEAYQPLDLPNSIVISPVTYTGFYQAGQEVEMTCWENRVWHHDASTKGAAGKATQENMAFAAGLKADVDMMKGWPVRSDTIYATLDARRLRHLTQWADTALVAAVVECMLASAGQYAADVRFLEVRIEGPAELARYGGVFSLKAYICGPIRREFDSN